MSLISIKNLTKTYVNGDVETRALRGVSLDIENGEFASIIGASGSGKSTLMHLLGFLDRPTSGEYYFEGKEASKYSDDELAMIRNKKIGFVFQTFNLLPRLTVAENIEIPLVYAGVSKKERKQKVEKVVDMVGIPQRINYETARLSGGERQRVAIARALINEPAIIFADEPTGNLDSKSGEVILDFFQKLNDEGNTIVVVTHESYVADSARRKISIKDGEVSKDEIVKNRHIVSSEGFNK